jgi:hypothetical protein
MCRIGKEDLAFLNNSDNFGYMRGFQHIITITTWQYQLLTFATMALTDNQQQAAAAAVVCYCTCRSGSADKRRMQLSTACRYQFLLAHLSILSYTAKLGHLNFSGMRL